MWPDLDAYRHSGHWSSASSARPGFVAMTHPELAHEHFTRRLAVETDADDVGSALRDGTADFVLIDARSPRAPTPPRTCPGAISLPHRDDHRRRSTRSRTARSSSTAGARAATPRRRPARRSAALGREVKRDARRLRVLRPRGLPGRGRARRASHQRPERPRRRSRSETMVGCSLPSERCSVLRDAYGAGHREHRDARESRAEWVLGGRVEDAIWDLPKRWWRPAPPGPRRWSPASSSGRSSERGPLGARARLVLRLRARRRRRGLARARRDRGPGRARAWSAISTRATAPCVNGRSVRRARLRRGDRAGRRRDRDPRALTSARARSRRACACARRAQAEGSSCRGAAEDAVLARRASPGVAPLGEVDLDQ